MKSFLEVAFAEEGAACNLVSPVSEVRERVMVQLCLLVELSKVPYRTKRAIRLIYKMDGGTICIRLGRIDFLDDP